MLTLTASIVILVSGFFAIASWLMMLGEVLNGDFSGIKRIDNIVQITLFTVLFYASGIYLFGF